MDVDGFYYETWYTMPVHLRNHYVEVIKRKSQEKNRKAQQQAQHFSQNIKGAK